MDPGKKFTDLRAALARSSHRVLQGCPEGPFWASIRASEGPIYSGAGGPWAPLAYAMGPLGGPLPPGL